MTASSETLISVAGATRQGYHEVVARGAVKRKLGLSQHGEDLVGFHEGTSPCEGDSERIGLWQARTILSPWC